MVFPVKEINCYLPTAVWIQTQNRCNFKCKICPYRKLAGQIPKGVMKDELFYKIISEIKDIKSIERISFNMQNEPLLDKEIFKRIAYIKSNAKLRVMITTNGYFLSKENILKLIDSKIDKITVSLNAFSHESYKRIVGNNYFKSIVNNIRALIKIRPLYLKIVLSFVVTRDNFHEMKNFENYWRNLGVFVRVYYANNKAGYLHDNTYIIPQQRDCRVPMEEINIRYNGDVVLCRPDWKNRIAFGNVNNNTVWEIWSGEKFSRFRRDFSTNIERLFPCKSCNRNSYSRELKPVHIKSE